MHHKFHKKANNTALEDHNHHRLNIMKILMFEVGIQKYENQNLKTYAQNNLVMQASSFTTTTI